MLDPFRFVYVPFAVQVTYVRALRETMQHDDCHLSIIIAGECDTNVPQT